MSRNRDNTKIVNESYWSRKPGRTVSYWLLRYPIVALLHLLYRVKFTDLENVPKSGAAILAPNHISALDPVFIFMGIRRRITALGNARYFQGKNAWFFKAMGQIPIIPGDDSSKVLALDCCEELLGEGQLVGIFPEGNRSRDGQLHRGRLGTAELAARTGAAVIPVGIRGSYEVLPRGKKWPRLFRRIEVHIGPALHLCDSSQRGLRTFTDALMMHIAVLSDQEYDDTYTEERKKSA